MTAPREFLSRDELLAGLPARRVSVLLFAIEARTARLVNRSRRAMAPAVAEAGAEARERAFLEAVAGGRESPLRPTIQDLERYARAWAALVPADAAMRAGLVHALAERHTFTTRVVPGLSWALGTGDPAVGRAYEQLYGQPLASAFAGELPWRERLRWRRTSAARRLEDLPPAWLAFALTLTEMVGGGILALPIALAAVGPSAAAVVLVVLGLVSMATLAAVVEAVTRDGDIRYGSTYFGRLARSYLGTAATAVLTPALLVFCVLVLIAFAVGVARTVADVTGVDATVWAAALFVVGVVVLRGENLNATVASALVVGAANIALIVTLAVIALAAVDPSNLRHVDVPLHGGDASALALVFGVVIASYFGHTSAGNAARVVLRRDASGRALTVGCAAAVATAIGLYCLFVVAVNGAVPPAAMANATGTALGPLADEAGASVNVVGIVFVILAMGMTSIHMSLAVANQVREWVPAAAPSRAGRVARGRLGRLLGGRAFWLAMSPVAATFAVVEWLLATGRGSFAGALSFLGTLTVPLIGGIFPMLMLAASRRKGEYVPGIVVRLLGRPLFVAGVLLLYLAVLLAYGLVIWKDPLERAAALAVAGVMVALTVALVRRGAFAPRAFVEVRVEQERGDRVVAVATVAGEPVEGSTELEFSEGDGFGALRSITVSLPASGAQTLKVRLHRVTTEGESEPLSGALELSGGTDRRRVDVDGVCVLPIVGWAHRLRLTFPGAGA